MYPIVLVVVVVVYILVLLLRTTQGQEEHSFDLCAFLCCEV